MSHTDHCECEDDFCCNDFPMLQIGEEAPNFLMEGFFKGEKKHYSLSDYKGKWVIMFFYPLDFTFVCPTEILEFSKKAKEFAALNTQVLGISVDSVFSHEAWLKDLGELEFPLLSDMTKSVSRDYNVLIEEQGIALRGAFVIDPEGVLRSYTVNDLSVGRNVDEFLRTIEAFQTGELCPVGWNKGDKTLGEA